MMTRRRFLSSAFASGLGVGLYTWRWEPHWVEFVERPLPVANLPERLQGNRLVQLSDLHIGPRVADSFLIETFDQIKSLAPDFVVCTGDLTSYHSDIGGHARRVFRHLPLGRKGTFGVLGNHDYGRSWAEADVADDLAEAATEAGMRILRNEVAEVEGLQIAGLDDLWAHRFELAQGLAGIKPEKAAIVLSHNPDTVDEPEWGNFAGWIFCGHTHGGQCKAPFLPPPLLPVKNRRYQAGEYALEGGRRMYINRGLGHLLQVRFNVRPEVTVFRLERTQKSEIST